MSDASAIFFLVSAYVLCVDDLTDLCTRPCVASVDGHENPTYLHEMKIENVNNRYTIVEHNVSRKLMSFCEV